MVTVDVMVTVNKMVTVEVDVMVTVICHRRSVTVAVLVPALSNIKIPRQTNCSCLLINSRDIDGTLSQFRT